MIFFLNYNHNLSIEANVLNYQGSVEKRGSNNKHYYDHM